MPPVELLESLQSYDVVLFLGAGLSIGAGLPGWANLIRPLAQTVGARWPTDEADLTTDHLLTAAQHYENQRGRHALIQHMRDMLDTTGIQLTPVHRLVASLPVRVIFTTNYDDLIERAWGQTGQRPNVIISEPELAFWSEERVKIVKLCGDLHRPESIIITRRDFNTYFATRSRLAERLRTTLESKTALFLGYSLQDPFFNQIWDHIGLDFGRLRRWSYAVLFDADALETDDLRQRGIHVINLEIRDRDCTVLLTEWLRAWTEDRKGASNKNMRVRNEAHSALRELADIMPPGIRPGESPTFHKLGEYVFQDLCRDLFDAEPSVAACGIYGTRGQSQDGIDLLAHREGGDGIEVGQCRCYENYGPAEIRNASDDFFDHWDRWSKEDVKRYILFVACELSRRQQQDEIIRQKRRFAEFGIEYEVWDAAKIRNKLRPHPGIVADYCKPVDHWVRVICGEVSPAFPSLKGLRLRTHGVVQAVLVNQYEQLAARMSGDIEGRLSRMRAAWREGRRDEVIEWLKGLEGDLAVRSVLSPQVKAKLLCFKASLELDLTGNVSRARQLADEAQALAPSYNQTRLRALIAYRETGPKAAIELLEDQEDIDSLNFRGLLLLEMGYADESLTILDFEEIGPER